MCVFTLSLLQFHFELLPLTRSAQNYGEVRREAFIYSFGFFGLRLLLIFESNRFDCWTNRDITSKTSPCPNLLPRKTAVVCLVPIGVRIWLPCAKQCLPCLQYLFPLLFTLLFPLPLPHPCYPFYFCFSSITVGGLKQKTWATNFAVNQQGSATTTKLNLHKTTGRSTRPSD